MRARTAIRFTIAARLSLLALFAVAASVGLTALMLRLLPSEPFVAVLIAIAIMAPIAVAAVRTQLRPLLGMLRALGGTVISYRDGDFSFGLHWERDDEMGDLVAAHNALGAVLREQRLDLVQRELLLDTMVQHTPVAMMLVDAAGKIVFANVAARQLLNEGRRLEGGGLEELLERTFPTLREAVERGGDGLFTVGGAADDAEDEIYHLSRRAFTLNARQHELLLLRHLTSELRRQEVQTWKKVIRVISHELNNSLAPIASLAKSGGELVRRGNAQRLPEILDTMEERARHLERFIEGYARFAKLPAPNRQPVEWTGFIDALALQVPFRVEGDLPAMPANFDASQMQQALLNLLKNAHESGSRPEEIRMSIRAGDPLAIEVTDRGTGMTETVMSNALVPFYSTKRAGTGLGLALAREIVEAHGGRIALSNREGGGLSVVLYLPV